MTATWIEPLFFSSSVRPSLSRMSRIAASAIEWPAAGLKKTEIALGTSVLRLAASWPGPELLLLSSERSADISCSCSSDDSAARKGLTAAKS